MSDLDLAPEPRQAIELGHAVVALESTVIAHGLPWPGNLALARRLEAVVREQGAVPATVGVLGGRMRVGLEDAELEYLARSPEVRKLTRRDIPVAIAEAAHGATTVSATLHIAHAGGASLAAKPGPAGAERVGGGPGGRGPVGRAPGMRVRHSLTSTI